VTPSALALPAGVAFAICALALLLLARFAHRLRLLDAPGTHKTHDDHVPSVGGIAIVAGALAGLALLPQASGPGMLATAMFGLLGVGVVDDLRGLSPRMRFLAQIVAALVLAA
jgi:UDP-GlcNAc:undecaprenyl-phosphate/decaprenyl-phosphate GlcNAc-1-phosphate transferase